MRHRFVACVVLLLAFACARSASAEWTREEDRWFELTLGGQPCGSIHFTRERDGERLRSTTLTTMKLGRGAAGSVGVTMHNTFIETVKGEPIEAAVRQSTGGAPTELAYRFTKAKGGWNVEVTERGATRQETVPSTEWLAPAALDRFVTERLTAGAREITYKSLDLESGLRVTNVAMRRAGAGTGIVEHDGPARQIPITLWDVVSDALPVPAVERYSNDGLLVESIAKLGIGELRTRLTSKDKAMAAATKGGAEVLVKSFVPSKTVVQGVQEKIHLTLRVKAKEGELVDLPSTGAQRVTRIAPNELELQIDADRGSEPTAADLKDPKLLAPSSLVNFDTLEVQKLLKKALEHRDNDSPRAKAEHLRRLVDKHIANKNLSSAFASAADAARSGSGDCSEHAVLLAALLRGAGIPSRVASGLIYADYFSGQKNVWAWHVWTQALLPKEKGEGMEWVDLDATLPVPFHAGHVCTAVGDLAGGATDPMWSISLGLMGNISIDVVAPSEQPVRTPALETSPVK